MDNIKFYNRVTGVKVIIPISQSHKNLNRSLNQKNRAMTLNEACYYADKAGLTRKKPKLKVDSSKK